MKLTKLSKNIRFAMTGMALTAAASSSWALGLGEVNVQSAVGQNLIAEVELLAEPNELGSLKLNLASSGEYQMQGLDFNPALIDARVTVKKNDAGKTIAQITTRLPVNDSYVQVILDGATAMGKVRRTYSIFIDPNKRATARLPGEASGASSISLKPTMPNLPPVKVASNSMPAYAPAAPAPELVSAPSKPSIDTDAAMRLTNITQRGQAPRNIDIAKGYGRQQSIKHALFTIVPKGWNGFAADSGVKFAAPVDWDGNRDWLSALDGLLASAHLGATVDWNKKEITFTSLSGSSQGQSPAPATKSPEVNLVAENSLREMKAQNAAQAIQIQDQALKVAALNQQIVDSNVKMSKVMDELAKARAESSAMGSSIGTNATRLKDLGAELDSAKLRSEKSEKELAAAAKQLEHMTAQLSAAKAAMGRTESRMGDFDSLVARSKLMERELEFSKKENLNLKAETANLVKSSSIEKEKQKAEFESANASQLKAFDEVKRQLSIAQTELAQSRSAFETQSTQYSDAQRRLLALTSGSTPTKPAVAALPLASSLQVVGKGTPDSYAVSNSGLNVAFSSALRQVVPQGWMVLADPSIGNKAVSWNGNSRNWTVVLDEILNGMGVKGVIDPVGREVTINK